MSKLKKILLRAYVTLLLASVLAVPGLAASTSSSISNAVGAGEGSYPLLSFAYYDSIQSSLVMDFSAFDGCIYRVNGSGDALHLTNRWLYFIFRMPPNNPDLAFNFSFDFPITVTRAITQEAYPSATGFTLSSYSYEFNSDEFGSFNDSGYGDGRAWVRCSSPDFTSRSEYRAIALFVPDVSIDIYANGKIGGLVVSPVSDSSSVSLRPASSSLSVSIPKTSISLSQSGSGRWKFGQAAYGYAVSNATSAATYALWRLWDNGYVTLANINRLDSAFPNTSISGIKLSGNMDAVSASASLPGYSGDVANTKYTSSAANVSSSNNILMYGQLDYTYHNDGGIVDNVAHMTDTLDGVASNMQKVVDDMQAHKDAGEDIGGTTSTDTISGTQETLSSGTQSFDTFTDTATDQLDSITSGASGYASLMTMAVPVILNFGPSGGIGPLHIALLVIVAIFGISFFVRRLL